MNEPDLVSWGRRLVPRAATVARLYLPGAPVDARRRELLATVVAGACRSPELVGLHVGWLEVLGPAELDVDDEVFGWARDAVATPPGEPLPPLPAAVDEVVAQALGAAVAHGVVAAVTAHRARSAVDRLIGRRPRSLPALASDLAVVGLGAPVLVPLAGAAGAVSVLGRLVPDPAELHVDADPNLLTQLLADALPAWLGGVGGRILVASLPVEVPLSWRSGRTGATVRIRRGRVLVHNGLAPDAWALFDGDVDSLVRAGSHTIARELRAAHATP